MPWISKSHKASVSPETSIEQNAKESQQAALEDTNIACVYAAEAGISLPPVAVNAVVSFRDAFSDSGSKVDASTEAAFWIGAGEIAAAISPVKMEALRARNAYRLDPDKSDIGRVVRNYRRLIWFTLYVTIGVHAFQVAIDGSLGRARDAAARFDAARLAVRSITLDVSPQDLVAQGLEFSKATATENSDPIDQLRIQRQLLCVAVQDWITEADQLARLVPQGDPWYVRSASFAITKIVGTDNRSIEDPVLPEREDKVVLERYKCGANSKPIFGDISIKDELSFTRLVGLGSGEGWSLVRSSKNLHAQLTKFMLPFLYGLLGAMASIVRSVSRDVSNVTFVPTSRVFYALRLPLGALTGATVGLLFAPSTLASLEGLTSLGVAFGLGYGVEVFFAAVDGLVGRLVRP